MHPKVNIKQIVIALIDRLAAYAAREAENEDPEETKRQEEAATRRLAEKVKIQKARIRQTGVNGSNAPETPSTEVASSGWGSVPETPVAEKAPAESEGPEEESQEKVDKGKEKEKVEETPEVKKFRGIPEDVKLFEVFWQQVVELIKVRNCNDSDVQRPKNGAGSARSIDPRHHSTAGIPDKSFVELLSRPAGICGPSFELRS